MSDEEKGINVMTVSYRGIENIDIISFNELPKERQGIAWDEPTDGVQIYKDVCLAIQNCLIDPSRWSEFEALPEKELFEFFWKWVISSTLTENGTERGLL